MEQVETKVDVLAVLADYSAQHGDPDDFEQARAAIAGLIEADREYDAALEQRNNPPNKRMRTLQDIEVRWARAICRRASALARVGGAK